MKPVQWRRVAELDVADAADGYAAEGGLALGDRFLDAVEASIVHLAQFPASGSLRYATALRLEGLRFWPINVFPYLIFYVDCPGHIDVWRVLHAQCEIPAWMQEQGP